MEKLGEDSMDELKSIMEKFADSGWELIAAPARGWRGGAAGKPLRPP